MSDDLVERLRAPWNWFSESSEGHRGPNNIPFDAADRIEELEEKLAKAVGGLKEISMQKRSDELAPEYDIEDADFEGGYDMCVDRARRTLAEMTGGGDDAN